ncbi:UrcA family protein [Allosphingosinicella deserti]|uniref:UrcA family protein n=1 Tax=Allosphingosinicella deserti TaxID=2116704 RepID=A0A2P7QLI0_9SPHN|nr:UrcA family protein [Sphingomonas deserti]PSJ38812.1 UrcA family protein [Sphingomonas deserti]
MKTLTFALTLLAAIPAGATAQQPRPEARVPYGDLNLQTEAGVKTLDRRLARAVMAVCPDERGTVDMARKVAARRCIKDASASLSPLRDRILAAQAAAEPQAVGTR